MAFAAVTLTTTAAASAGTPVNGAVTVSPASMGPSPPRVSRTRVGVVDTNPSEAAAATGLRSNPGEPITRVIAPTSGTSDHMARRLNSDIPVDEVTDRSLMNMGNSWSWK